MINDNEFYKTVDDMFVATYGDKGKRWLTLMEDIDPEDMIWEYVKEVRRASYDEGFTKGYEEGIDDEGI